MNIFLSILVVSLRSSLSFEVLDAGAPRTGTQSLAKALSILGYKTYHSGYAWREGKRDAKFPCNQYVCAGGALQPCLDTLDGWDAAFDEPYDLLYEEILTHLNPDAKVILPVKTPEEWFKSYERYSDEQAPSTDVSSRILEGSSLLQHDIQQRRAVKSNKSELEPLAEKLASADDCFGSRFWGCQFFLDVQPDEVKERCIESYNNHNEHVKNVVPAKQLLEFNYSDGWEPLCKFLGKPVPDEPFPYNDLYNAEHTPLKWNNESDADKAAATLLTKR